MQVQPIALSEYSDIQHTARTQLTTMGEKELDNDWKLNDFFESVMVINLPRAHERRESITQQLRDIGTKNFEIFPAIDGRQGEVNPAIWNKLTINLHNIDTNTPEGVEEFNNLHKGQAGCYLSHFRIIQKMKKLFDDSCKNLELAQMSGEPDAIASAMQQVRKYSRVLILEDDSGFGILNNTEKQVSKTGDDSGFGILNSTGQQVSKTGTGKILREALSELPDNWDILYFVVHPTEPTQQVSSRLYKIKDSWALSAYAVNHRMYDHLIELLKKIEDPSVTHISPVDNEIASIHHLHNVYAISPSLVFSQPCRSYITNKVWAELWQDQPIL